VSDQAGGLESAAEPKADRFPCFDGLRAIAATTVVVVHASIGAGATHRGGGEYLARMDIGVSIFFLISGFLLYRPFVKAHLGGRPAPTTLLFWRRRVLRIVPAYWVALAVIAFVLGLKTLSGFGDIAVYFGFLQIYDPDRVLGGLSQAWSLCTELSFYAFIPAYALLVRRVGRGGSAGVRVEVVGVAVLYVVSVLFRAAILALDASPVAFNWLPAWFDLFALGMVLAIASVWTEEHGRSSALVAWIGDHPGTCWLAAAVCFWAVSTQLGLPRELFQPTSVVQRFGRQFLYGAVAWFLLLPAIFGPQDRGWVRRLLRSRPFATVGLVSYGIYLWHIAVIDKTLGWAGQRAGSADLLLLLAAGLAGSFVVAGVSYIVVERPALRLKNPRAPVMARTN
jgi:peptidoglycan/LPS O-acetylase OafA/YrhL